MGERLEECSKVKDTVSRLEESEKKFEKFDEKLEAVDKRVTRRRDEIDDLKNSLKPTAFDNKPRPRSVSDTRSSRDYGGRYRSDSERYLNDRNTYSNGSRSRSRYSKY